MLHLISGSLALQTAGLQMKSSLRGQKATAAAFPSWRALQKMPAASWRSRGGKTGSRWYSSSPWPIRPPLLLGNRKKPRTWHCCSPRCAVLFMYLSCRHLEGLSAAGIAHDAGNCDIRCHCSRSSALSEKPARRHKPPGRSATNRRHSSFKKPRRYGRR